MLFPRQQIAHAHAGFTRTQPDWAPKKYSAFFERKKEACGRDDGERRQAVSRAGHMLDPPTPPRPHPPKKNLLHPTPPHLLLSPLYQATSLQTSQQPVRPSNLCTQFVKTLCGIWFLGFFVCLILGVLYLSRFLCENWGGLKVIIMLFSYFLLFTIKVFLYKQSSFCAVQLVLFTALSRNKMRDVDDVLRWRSVYCHRGMKPGRVHILMTSQNCDFSFF